MKKTKLENQQQVWKGCKKQPVRQQACLSYTSIPRFSLPVKLGNGKEEMELEILEEIIQQNYIKIIEDVNAILKKIEDKLKEKSAVPPTGTHKTEQKIIR